jgi:transcriptional regulator of arginine metabolism
MRNFIHSRPVMPTDTLEQRERREAIARLLDRNAIHRQAELVELLRGEGFAATQSSVSRDLRDLGAIKLKNGYSLPKRSDVSNAQALHVVAEFVRDIRTAGPNLLVITTAVGAAQRVAVTLDRIDWPEIVGTLSGDDTIFVATVGSTQQRRLRGRLRHNLKKATP